MDCIEVKPKLEAFVMGRLKGEAKSAIDEHFVTCEGCRLEAELARAVLGAPPAPPVAVPPPPPAEPAAVPPTLAAEPSSPPALSLAPIEPDAPPPIDPPQEVASHIDPSAIHLPELDEANRAASPTPVLDSEVSFADVEYQAIHGKGKRAEDPEAGATASALPAEATGKKARWGFEPAEPPREAAPPEKSLFFAEEALARKEKPTEPGPKLPVRRIVMWSGGALLGLGLLAVSVWMAFAFHAVPSHEPGHAGFATTNSTPIGTHSAPPAAGQPTASAPSAPAPGTSTAQPGNPNTTQGLIASAPGSTTGQALPSNAAGAAAPGGAAASSTPSGTPLASSNLAITSGAKPGSAATSQPPASPRAGSTSTQSSESEASPVPYVTKITTPMKPVHDDMADDFKTDPDAEAPSHDEVVHVPLTKHAGGGYSATSSPPTSSVAPSPAPASAPASKATTPDLDNPAVSGPIDRLHLATEHATKTSDLDALRRLKTTWKDFIRTSTGLDRSRAKREYADCLWGIQAVTGRDSDRKEALVAYRDYVLNAPAGGTDTRTVSRMRTLEDALSESQ